jgi:hypothetical protein
MRLRNMLRWLRVGTIVGGIAFSVLTAFGDEELDKKCARVINVERKVACGDQSLLVICKTFAVTLSKSAPAYRELTRSGIAA